MAPAPETAPSPNSSRASPPKSSPPPPTLSTPPPPKSPPPSPSSLPLRYLPPPSPPPPRRSPPPPSPPKKGKGGTSPPPPPSPSKQSPPLRFQTPPAVFFPPPDNVARNLSPPPPTGKLNKSPSHKTHHRSSDGSHTDHSETSNEVTIIGFALAAFVFLSLVTICVTCIRRKKKQKEGAYYMKPPSGANGGGNYYKNQWRASPHEHVIKFTTPGMMGKPVGVGGRWGTSPQSNMSAGNFSPPPNMPLAFSISHFSYNELSAATGGFSKSNLLGQGGFGYVHKGILLDGQEVAVKSLKSGSNQGEREFQAEVEIISRVHHRHLVSLVGYCIANAKRMLVYEHVPNKTLEFHLHGKGCPVMSWETRIRIALGTAKGLAYLHEDCDPRIIHRDIKSSNILLDHNLEAKVADFGLAKLASVEDTHISTRVMGTFGYLAPEYASSGKLTEKSDVFSFGVMLLELLTRKKPIDPTNNDMEDSLVEWAGPLLAKALEDRNYDKLVDPRLEGKYDPNEVARMAAGAAASIRHSARRRPKMSQIVRALEGDGPLDALNDALKPRRTGSMVSLNQSPDLSTSIVYDTRAYNEDTRKFKEMVMSIQDFTSS